MDKVLLIGGNGYIGSRLCIELKQKDIPFSILDRKTWGLGHAFEMFHVDMRAVSTEFLRNYSHIVLLAGSSSVPMAKNAPTLAIHNNVVYFQELLDMIEDQSLIYASSGGVYTGMSDATEDDPIGNPSNIYDATKKWIDELASMSDKRTYGLRFGTINGWSPNLRTDLMINKMYHSDVLKVQNAWAERSILDISDAVNSIIAIIQEDPDPGIYNVCSFSATIEEIAIEVANATGQELIFERDTPGVYTFSFSTEKLSSIYRPVGTLHGIVESLAKESKVMGGREWP